MALPSSWACGLSCPVLPWSTVSISGLRQAADAGSIPAASALFRSLDEPGSRGPRMTPFAGALCTPRSSSVRAWSPIT
jgi:hypothetical protein